MRTPLRASIGILAAICLVASSACSSDKPAAGSTPTPVSTVGAADGLLNEPTVNTAQAGPTNRFVISWKPGSPAAQAMESVEAYGVDILSSLPQEDQEAIKAAAAKLSVTVESASAHVGGVTAVQLSQALDSDAAKKFIELIKSSDVVQSVMAEGRASVTSGSAAAGSPARPGGFHPGTVDGALGQDPQQLPGGWGTTHNQTPGGSGSSGADSQGDQDEEGNRGSAQNAQNATTNDIPNAPNDTFFNYQGNIGGSQYGVDATTAWSQTTGAGVTVAVIDAGIVDHPDIRDQILPGYDFISDPAVARDNDGRDADPTDMGDGVYANACGQGDPEQDHPSSYHGAHVAGIIGAQTNNDTGIAGVAPGVKIVPVRVLGACGGSDMDVIDAITWASGGHVPGVADNPNPAQIINMSLGGKGTCPAYYQEAINGAASRGSIVIASAGNEDDDAASYTPAGCENVLTVGATNAGGARTYFSNYGSTVEVSAPGGEIETDGGILSLYSPAETAAGKEPYRFVNGTSQAAPHVAGVAALLKSLNPNLTGQEITSILQSTSQPLTQCDTDSCGSGIVNARSAVTSVTGTDPGQPQPTAEPTEPAEETPDPGAPEPAPSESATSSWWDDLFGDDGGGDQGATPAPGETSTSSWWDDLFGDDSGDGSGQ